MQQGFNCIVKLNVTDLGKSCHPHERALQLCQNPLHIQKGKGVLVMVRVIHVFYIIREVI